MARSGVVEDGAVAGDEDQVVSSRRRDQHSIGRISVSKIRQLTHINHEIDVKRQQSRACGSYSFGQPAPDVSTNHDLQ